MQTVYSQSITWQRTYDGPIHFFDGGHDVCSDGNGNFFIVGFTMFGGSGGDRIWVIKINAYGDTLWTKVAGNGVANACVSSGDGGVVLTGSLNQAFSKKLDANGNIVWQKFYGGSFIQCYNIIKTIDNGYIACGRDVNSHSDGYIYKIDSIGDIQWQQIYPALEFKTLNSIIEIPGTGYTLTGTSLDIPPDTAKCLLLKIDLSGNVIWEKKYKIQNRGASGHNIIDLGDKYLVGGSTVDSLSTLSQPYIMKTDTSGNLLFTKIFSSTFSEYYGDLNIVNNNRYILAMSRDLGLTLPGKAIITDSLGNILVEKMFPTASFIDFRKILPIKNGDIMFVGIVEFACSTDCEDVYAVRSDSNLIFPPPIGINSYSEIIPDKFELYQNYPNPFNPITKIKFSVPVKQYIQLNIYDALGRRIKTLVNENLNPGTYEAEFDASGLASGMYFYSLEAVDPSSYASQPFGSLRVTFKETKKMVLIK